MTVAYGGQTSATTPVQVVAGAFGMFTAFPSGWGQAAATDLNSQQNTIIHTFHPGDYVTLWGTGLGAAPGFDAQPPTKATPVGSVTVYIGATTASNVLYHGRSGCCSGLDQVTFQIPSGVEGCYVPVGVDAGSGIGDLATIAVSNSGNTCGDSLMGQDLVNKLAAGQNVTFGYMRMISQVASGRTWETDYAYASFATYQPAYASVAEFPPSAGYCIAAPLGITDLSDLSLGFLGAGVDAGPISIVGPTGNANVTDFGGGDYGANLYGASGRFIWGGEQYTITGGGSANIGSFTINDTTNVPNVEFSNVTTDMVVPRSSDLTVKWSGGDPSKQNGNVTIGGYSWNNAFTEVESFQCVTQLSAGQFTIPQYLVGMMPETASTINAIPQGFLWIGQRNNPVVFPATPGLDLGILVDGISNGVDVFFQ